MPTSPPAPRRSQVDPLEATRALQALERIGAALVFGRRSTIAIPDQAGRQINDDVPVGPAADPDVLIRRLDLALTGGTLSPPQFQIIREAMLRIGTSTWQWHRERLRLAIYLIVTSADFNVLR